MVYNAHQVDDHGVIINTIVVESLDAMPNLVDASIGGGIGDSIIDGVLRPCVPEVVLAEAIPMLNLKLQLIEDGKLTGVEQIISVMTGADGQRAKAYWNTALTARRDNYLVNQLWPLIGYTEDQFNAAWVRAAALQP